VRFSSKEFLCIIMHSFARSPASSTQDEVSSQVLINRPRRYYLDGKPTKLPMYIPQISRASTNPSSTVNTLTSQKLSKSVEDKWKLVADSVRNFIEAIKEHNLHLKLNHRRNNSTNSISISPKRPLEENHFSIHEARTENLPRQRKRSASMPSLNSWDINYNWKRRKENRKDVLRLFTSRYSSLQSMEEKFTEELRKEDNKKFGGNSKIAQSKLATKILSDRLIIISGTLETSIDLMINNDTEEKTYSEFLGVFLLTFRWFITPCEFLKILIKRYFPEHETIPSNPNEQKRVCVLLKVWIEQCFCDFCEDENGSGDFSSKNDTLLLFIEFCDSILLKSNNLKKWGEMLKGTIQKKFTYKYLFGVSYVAEKLSKQFLTELSCESEPSSHLLNGEECFLWMKNQFGMNEDEINLVGMKLLQLKYIKEAERGQKN